MIATKNKEQLFNFTVSFKNIADLFNYILDGCETIDEARQKIKVFSEMEIAPSEIAENASDYMKNQREKGRMRVQRYRERQKIKATHEQSKCVYCGKAASEIDHIIPKSKGGSDVPENLVSACKECNHSKGNKGIDEFLNFSINDIYLCVDHNLVQSNPKIMNLVCFDGERYHMKSK